MNPSVSLITFALSAQLAFFATNTTVHASVYLISEESRWRIIDFIATKLGSDDDERELDELFDDKLIGKLLDHDPTALAVLKDAYARAQLLEAHIEGEEGVSCLADFVTEMAQTSANKQLRSHASRDETDWTVVSISSYPKSPRFNASVVLRAQLLRLAHELCCGRKDGADDNGRQRNGKKKNIRSLWEKMKGHTSKAGSDSHTVHDLVIKNIDGNAWLILAPIHIDEATALTKIMSAVHDINAYEGNEDRSLVLAQMIGSISTKPLLRYVCNELEKLGIDFKQITTSTPDNTSPTHFERFRLQFNNLALQLVEHATEAFKQTHKATIEQIRTQMGSKKNLRKNEKPDSSQLLRVEIHDRTNNLWIIEAPNMAELKGSLINALGEFATSSNALRIVAEGSGVTVVLKRHDGNLWSTNLADVEKAEEEVQHFDDDEGENATDPTNDVRDH